jgi:hypothetical protein
LKHYQFWQFANGLTWTCVECETVVANGRTSNPSKQCTECRAKKPKPEQHQPDASSNEDIIETLKEEVKNLKEKLATVLKDASGKSSSGDDDDSHKSGGDVDVDSSDEDESNRSGTLINGVRNSYLTIQINDLLEI